MRLEERKLLSDIFKLCGTEILYTVKSGLGFCKSCDVFEAKYRLRQIKTRTPLVTREEGKSRRKSIIDMDK